MSNQMEQWVPQDEILSNVVAMFRDTLSGNNERLQQIMELMQQLETQPDFPVILFNIN